MDKTIGISEFRQTIAEKIKDVHQNRSRYIIVQRSKARAVLISPEELEFLVGAGRKRKVNVNEKIKSEIPTKNRTSYDEFFGKQSLNGKRSS